MNQLYTGCVENRNDPLKLGRCQVRVVGLHTHDKSELPTSDLPWAYPMQPITSAALSGIGAAPVGPVEGTWVIVMFRDDDNQQPIIIGTIGGIPDKVKDVSASDSDTLVVVQDGSITVDSSSTTTDAGQVVQDKFEAGGAGTGEEIKLDGARRASDWTPSQACYDVITKHEGYASSDATRNKPAKIGSTCYAYQDSVGKWTIGYGSTVIDGQPVVQGMSISYEKALAALKEHVVKTAAPAVQRNTRAPVTQSMFDALVSFTYNLGGGAYAKSSLCAEVNSGKYEDAAASFMLYTKAGGKELAGLVRRRTDEKNLFLTGGVPNSAGEIPPATAQQSGQTTAGAIAAQMGFCDPNGKYPLYYNEPDTSRLARHEMIEKTIVYKKEAAELTGVPKAGGGTWDQPRTPYNAQYPFNHVLETESGHVMEFDDTPKDERVHIYHKTGTFTEIDANGTQVNRIVGDNFEICERNGHVKIFGSCNVNIDGAYNVTVGNAMNLDVSGAANINIFNNANLNVSGAMNISAAEDLKIRAATISLEAHTGDVNIKSVGSVNAQANAMMNLKSAGDLSLFSGMQASMKAIGKATVDGALTLIAQGASKTANSAEGTGLPDPAAKQTPEMPEFGALRTLGRSASASFNYETPEEGDPSTFQALAIASGAVRKEDLNSGTEQAASGVSKNNVAPKNASCDIIFGMERWETSFILSPHFKLGQLTSNGTRMPVAQQGLTAQQIVCNLKGLAENCLEVIYDMYPNMIISSGFRRPGDVAASSKTSDHYLGCAADIQIPNLDRKGHYEAILKIQQKIPYSQLLLEYAGSRSVWIHVSFKYENRKNEVFTMRDHKRVSDFGKFVYIA